jgi:3-phenylpropionate/trans-cinnamate dioxygenase ferredoxin subunit
VVARAGDILVGDRLIVDVAGRSIGVFNIDGTLYAIRNRCPHQGAELCRGAVLGTVAAPQPGDFRIDHEKPLLSCPWHGWEFDLRTGQSWWDPKKTRVRDYPVDVVADEEAGEEFADERRPGPFVADRYPVTEEDFLIVVDIGGEKDSPMGAG